MNKVPADEMRAVPQSRVMGIDFLFDDFDRLIQTPESVHRLRRFILDLAVRGKLVPQDVNDEPASQLLKRIAAEKVRLVKAGEIRKQKAIPGLAVKDTPFTLPENWEWSQIAEIGVRSPRNDATDDTLASFVPMPMIATDYGAASNHEVRRWGDIKKGYTHFAEGDVGLAKITPCFQNGKSTVFRNLTGGLGSGTTELHIVRPLLVNPNFILLFLKCPYFIETGIPKMTGTAGQKRVPAEYFAYSPFPLPPLAELHRIVAKVDELMALCDRLEAARAKREATRDRLATANLARLNAPDPEPATFQRDVAFALSNLALLTTRPDQIKALRQTILNLAVRGKLVPQDSKEDRSNQGQLRSDTTAEAYDMGAFDVRRALFKRPDNWTIEPLSRVSLHIVDCLHSTPKWTEQGVLCIKTNQVKAGQLDLTSPNFVSENTYKARVNRLEPRQDDILYIREGGVLGVACLVPSNTRLCLGQRLMQIRANNAIAPQFLELCLNSPWITEFAAEKTTGGAAPRVNMSMVRSYPIPLPPLPEQHRIVAKVDELIAMCNRLEARLNRVDKMRGELVELLCARVV